MGIGEVGHRERYYALDAGLEPDHTGFADVLFVGDADEGKYQPVEWMSRINDLDLADWQERELYRGILLVGVCPPRAYPPPRC